MITDSLGSGMSRTLRIHIYSPTSREKNGGRKKRFVQASKSILELDQAVYLEMTMLEPRQGGMSSLQWGFIQTAPEVFDIALAVRFSIVLQLL